MGMYRQAGDTARPQTQAGGVWGWWLRLTAPPGATNYDAARTPEVRERLRRAGLNSAVAPGVALAPLLLAAQAKVDEITMVGIVALPIIAILALILNRSGLQTASAIVLILGMDAVVEGALVGAGLRGGGLGAGWLLTFDLFVVPLIAAGLLLPRRYLWLFAALHIAFILFDYYRLPHAPDLDALVVLWNGAAIAFARPILIQLLGAVLSFVEVRSTDQAIRRADRAEEIAAMEHTIVEQKRQLDYGIQLILDTHVRAANGDFNARAPLTQENVLWQIAASLNNLLSRLQRAGAAEHQLRRTDEEIRRLATAIRDAQQGRPPIWPAPAGTSADLLLELIGRGAQGGRGMRQAPPLQAPQASQQMPQSAPVQAPQSAPQTGGYSQAGGYSSAGGFVPAAQSATGPYPQPWPNNPNNFAPGQAPRADAAPAAPQDNPWINPGDEDLR